MHSWTVTESALTSLDGFSLEWLPPAAYDYINPEIQRKPDGSVVIQIETGPFVGTIPLENGDVLRIVPQAGEKALWRMLMYSEDLADQLRHEFEKFTQVGYTDEGSTSWVSLLARSYFEQLRFIEKNSLRTERVLVNRRRNSTRGKVKLLPTLVSLTHHESSPVHCSYKERTFYTPEHKVLAAGALRLYQLASIDAQHRDLAIRWANRLVGRLKESDLLTVLVGLRTRRYTGSRSYYIPALFMARLLLLEAGITFDESADISSEVLLTNIRTLFERYILAIVRVALGDNGFIVDKPTENPQPLFEDGTCNMIPDVMVSNSGGFQLIVDAKYKIDKPIAEADYYQMFTYLNSYGVKKGVLVFPTVGGSQPSITLRRTTEGLLIYEIRTPLDDWTITEEFLTKETRQLVGI